jgi:hypothetical protein
VRPLEEALANFQRTRDDYVKPTYDITVKMAAGEDVQPAEFMQFGLAIARQMPPPLAESAAPGAAAS